LLDGGSIPKNAWPKAGQTKVRGCSALADNCMISSERARSERRRNCEEKNRQT